MLENIHKIISSLESDVWFSISYVIYGILFVLLLHSRKLNSKVAIATEASRPLTCLADYMCPREKKVKSKGAINQAWKARLLRKVDWLIYDKLKIIPDKKAGRNINFLLFLLGPIIIITFIEGYFNNEIRNTYITVRNFGYQGGESMDLQLAFILIFAYLALIVAIIFLFGKNREMYLDNAILFFFYYITVFKLFSCFRYGCCFGIPSEWGLYNEFLKDVAFPIALFEFIVGIILFTLCFIYMGFAKSYKPGQLCSLCLMSYAIPRFFWDFLRYHGESFRATEADSILGLTMVQVNCIIAVVISIVWLFILPYEKKIMEKFTAFILLKIKKIFAKIYFSKRLHKFSSNHFAWYPGIEKLKEVHTP